MISQSGCTGSNKASSLPTLFIHAEVVHFIPPLQPRCELLDGNELKRNV